MKDVIRGGFYDALDWTTSSIIREPGVVILNNDKTVGGECLTRSGTVLEEEREEIKKKKKKKSSRNSVVIFLKVLVNSLRKIECWSLLLPCEGGTNALLVNDPHQCYFALTTTRQAAV